MRPGPRKISEGQCHLAKRGEAPVVLVLGRGRTRPGCGSRWPGILRVLRFCLLPSQGALHSHVRYKEDRGPQHVRAYISL